MLGPFSCFDCLSLLFGVKMAAITLFLLVIYMPETRGYDRRIKTNIRACIECGCKINRGLRCGPCRDVADERRRQAAYAAKKRAKLLAG